MCWVPICSLFSRSAIVRDTFNMRLYARAESPSLFIAISIRWSESSSILQYFRICLGFMWALAKMPSDLKRSCWTCRARVTRAN